MSRATWYIVIATSPERGQPRSFVRHATLDIARKEAIRLAQLEGGEFVVYKAKVVTKGEFSVTETGLGR